jgi:mRNA interferase MazF
MPSFSTNEIILVRYPFSDLSAAKVRPAVIVSVFADSPDCLIVPLTSRTSGLAAGEFALADWSGAGLNLPSAVKRGIYTIHSRLVVKSVGRISTADAEQLRTSLRQWLNLS